MIISSEHQDLLEEFKKANELECEAIKQMSDYAETTPKPDKVIAKKLFMKFEEALERKMALYEKLREFDVSQQDL